MLVGGDGAIIGVGVVGGVVSVVVVIVVVVVVVGVLVVFVVICPFECKNVKRLSM